MYLAFFRACDKQLGPHLVDDVVGDLGGRRQVPGVQAPNGVAEWSLVEI